MLGQFTPDQVGAQSPTQPAAAPSTDPIVSGTALGGLHPTDQPPGPAQPGGPQNPVSGRAVRPGDPDTAGGRGVPNLGIFSPEQQAPNPEPFRAATGHDPVTAEHWKTAEILDPSWGGAGHVNSIVGETKITPVPGAGRVYGDGFIHRDEVIGAPPDLTRVTGFDNASIHELASTARDCARRRVDLHAVLKAHSPLEQHLRFAGVTHVLPVHHCLVGALPDCDDPDSSRGASRSCGT